MTETCETCRFFSYKLPTGECRRYPKTQRKTADQWCGEWQGQPQEYAPEVEEVAQALGGISKESTYHGLKVTPVGSDLVPDSDLDPPQPNAKPEGAQDG